MTKKKTRRLNVGAHMSISGGVDKAIERGDAVGCETIQIFTKSSNQWRARPLATEEIDRFHQLQEQTGIDPIVAHDSYLINIASPKEDLHEKSVAALAIELERCQTLRIPYLVMHPGSHVGEGEPYAIERIAETLNALFDKDGTDVRICLETTAGQGTNLGHRFEHLAEIIDRVDASDERLGVCVDTCHIFAAGYEVNTAKQWKQTFEMFDASVGLDQIRCFHVNDSKKAAGSRVDRHDSIGQGHMGIDPFRHLMNDTRFRDLPKLLETPKGDDDTADLANLKALRDLVR